MAVTPTASETPLQFRSTTLWRGQLLVNAANAASRDWLLRSLNNIRPWSDVRLVALDPQTLRLRRALVWVPGQKPLPDKDTLSVLEKQNPGLACSKWKIWSRKEEPQGLGLPYFSATRARVTLTARHTKSKGGTAKAGTAKADTSHAPNEEEGSAEAEPPNPAEFIQANIQHGKAQSAFLCKRIIECQIKIALIQEPWVYHGKVRGLGRAGGTVYYCPLAEEPRACILVKGAKGVFPMPGLCTRDLAVIKLAIGKGNTKREVAICSAYFPRNTESPPRELSDLIRYCEGIGLPYCEGIGLPLLVGCDSNSHHTMWGDKEVKPRGRMLLEFLTLSGMQIANRDRYPPISHLRGSRHIFFGLDESIQLIENGYRNPRATQWDLYLEDLKGRLIGISIPIRKRGRPNCPLKQRTSSSKKPWWNSHVESHRRKVRKLFNKAKRTKNPNHWEDYKSAQREYKVIRDSIRDTWRASCEDIIQLPSAARLSKDSVEPTICPSPKLGIQIPSRDDWDNTNNTICQNGIIWFTDGSKIGDKAGAGVYGKTTRTKLSFALGSYASVFQAEIYAILACGMEILKTAPKRRTIPICTDSQAALMAIESSKVKSRLVLDCKKILNDLASCNRVILTWVPGHSGVPGNEEADRLARLGSIGYPIGPEPILGSPIQWGFQP
ncbi:hypothetical protein NQ318_002847 [Aromia moschata]|uniref:RNase H type-1 domain-containing protein n=1 Tax=Aromia moschata TaxID=1265417 RepID=A0AAV8XUN3_9CUCU|nr:hypothetical protein NQ318_002847 [Aromia moschata]